MHRLGLLVLAPLLWSPAATAASCADPPPGATRAADWSGQDLSGRDFRGAVWDQVILTGAKLRGANLSGATICASDLTGADLTGAKLEGATIGGQSSLDDANLKGISARGLVATEAKFDNAILDGADLREAQLGCPLSDDFMNCLAGGPLSVTRADLRGATAPHFCCDTAGLDSAKLDGLTTELPPNRREFSDLAKGVGANGSVTFQPTYGWQGEETRFGGGELARLGAVIAAMRAGSSRPGFDCAKASSPVEKDICADPALGALDAALGWVWQRLTPSPADKAAQRAWLAERAACAAKSGCLTTMYVERLRALGPKAKPAPIPDGRYADQPKLLATASPDAVLAEKYLKALGLPAGQITITDWRDGRGGVTGEELGANYHSCSLDTEESEVRVSGLVTRIGKDDEATAWIVTPSVIVLVDGWNAGCGARASWAEVYYRQ